MVAPERFEAEKNYPAAREIAEGFLKKDLLTEEEFTKIEDELRFEMKSAQSHFKLHCQNRLISSRNQAIFYIKVSTEEKARIP